MMSPAHVDRCFHIHTFSLFHIIHFSCGDETKICVWPGTHPQPSSLGLSQKTLLGPLGVGCQS